ncbi:MAG: flagellar filament capping protein FliD [Burkholderiaceae bacterium]|nr:flagellar filament capping protein FliD [Burkholderiaceae bacterium]
MAISSIGIGSNLPVEDIITKLVAVEKQPLANLQTKATLITSKISAYGQIQSLASSLNSAVTALGKPATWQAVSVRSSDSTAVTATASSTSPPAPGSYSLSVQQLARAQSAASASIASGAPVGAGTLSIQLGTWSGTSFAAGAAAAIDVEVTDTDTLSTIASRINAAGAGVTATVMSDASGQRLLLRSDSTGEASGFRIQVDEGAADDGDRATGLSRLGFDFDGATGWGMAANTASTQYGANAQATLNGVALSSSSNTFADLLPGLSITVARETTTATELTVSRDTASMKTAVQGFVSAYNALSAYLTTATKYDASTETASLLQGDSTAVGMQNSLRTVLGALTSGGAFGRLSDIGIAMQTDGTLAIDGTKLDTALKDVASMRNLFAVDNEGPANDGLALKLMELTSRLTGTEGAIANRTTALQEEQKQNGKDQDKVNDRATRVEARLRKQYTALDAKMAQLTALDTYIQQQVAQWNKSSSN